VKQPRRSRLALVLWCAILGVAEGCAGRVGPNKTVPKEPASGLRFTATAYCTGRVTATGTAPTKKTVAADPAVLPLGSQIRLTGLDKRHNGVYVVRDTGARVRGRRIDLYMRDCHEAVRFGRRSASVSILN
jgi:3D (Asp-Asp-Asp) domain-containing protein